MERLGRWDVIRALSGMESESSSISSLHMIYLLVSLIVEYCEILNDIVYETHMVFAVPYFVFLQMWKVI